MNNVKKVVINETKNVIVEINNGIVKIITDGQTATSDGNLYAFDDVHHDIYVVLDDSAISYSGLGDSKELLFYFFTKHYVKSARIWSFSGPYFPVFRLNTEK